MNQVVVHLDGVSTVGQAVAVVGVPARAGGGRSSNPGRSSGRVSSSGGSSRSGGSSSGGGGVYVPGGSGYYGGGGGGIGGFGGIICLLIVILVVVALVMAKRSGGGTANFLTSGYDSSMDEPPPPPPIPQEAPGTREALAAIDERDPAFDEQVFLNQANNAYYLVQKAWVDQQPALSRKVMADAIWTRHRQQIEAMIQAGKRNVLEDLNVATTTTVAATTDKNIDSITVRFYTVGRDYDIDAQAKMVGGDRTLRGWQEDWVFQRSSSAKTKDGTLNNKCPNCGAPLDLDTNGVCKYCKTMVMGGKHDWVLTRIDQVFDRDPNSGY